MAIEKSVDLDSGVPATYWMIVDTHVLHEQRTAILRWHGWISEEARALGRKMVDERLEYVPVSDEAIAAIYGFGTPVSQFADGTPILDDAWKQPLQKNADDD